MLTPRPRRLLRSNPSSARFQRPNASRVALQVRNRIASRMDEPENVHLKRDQLRIGFLEQVVDELAVLPRLELPPVRVPQELIAAVVDLSADVVELCRGGHC